jgi:hypothetical protein
MVNQLVAGVKSCCPLRASSFPLTNNDKKHFERERASLFWADAK